MWDLSRPTLLQMLLYNEAIPFMCSFVNYNLDEGHFRVAVDFITFSGPVAAQNNLPFTVTRITKFNSIRVTV